MHRREFQRTVLAAASSLIIPQVADAQSSKTPKTPSNPPTGPTILWSASHEVGNLSEWSQSGSPSVSSGGNMSDDENNEDLEVNVTTAKPYAGSFSAHTKIKRAQNRKIGIRLMRWRDRFGNVLPEEAYYSTRMFIPHATYRMPSGWWNVFQFKSRHFTSGTETVSDPTLTGNLTGDGQGYWFHFTDHRRNKITYPSSVKVRGGQWVHLEAWMRWHPTQGAVKLWQNGVLTIDKSNLSTKFTANDPIFSWGIGNYTDNILGHPAGPGIAEIYFDNAVISTVRQGMQTT